MKESSMLKQYIKMYSYQLIFVFAISSFCFANNPNNKQEIEDYLKKIDDVLNKMSNDNMLDNMIAQEKIKLIQGHMKESEQEKSDLKEDKEAHFFTPKNPKPLTEEEKKINIHDRIAKKYIGKIPVQVNNLIFYYTHHEVCIKNNQGVYNRLLMHGHPGTGKSYLFKVVSQELQIPTLVFSASFFADKYIGESSRRIRRAFDEAKKLNKPILIFIDEIDALATKRKDSTHDEHRATLITLLTELQELQENKNIFVIAATNDIDSLDPAIKDRFAGSVCEIKESTIEERAQLIEKIFAELNIKSNLEFSTRLAQVLDTKIQDKEKYLLKEGKEHGTFSNRDLEYILRTASLMWFADCTKNKENCKKTICPYLRQAIDSTGKTAGYAYWSSGKYCDGI